MSQSTKDPVFEHGQIARIGAHQLYTARVMNADDMEPGDYRQWAAAAFANTSNLTAISVYSSNGRTVLILNTKRQENPVRMRMQNDHVHAMLPMETEDGEMAPFEDLPVVSESGLVASYLNRAYWSQPSPRFMIHEIRGLVTAPVVTLAMFNHAFNQPNENGVIPRRVSGRVLKRDKVKAKLKGPYGNECPIEKPKVKSDQFGTMYLMGYVPSLSEVAFEMGGQLQDSLVIMPQVTTHTVRRVPEEPMMEVITELRGLYIAGIII